MLVPEGCFGAWQPVRSYVMLSLIVLCCSCCVARDVTVCVRRALAFMGKRNKDLLATQAAKRDRLRELRAAQAQAQAEAYAVAQVEAQALARAFVQARDDDIHALFRGANHQRSHGRRK